MPCLMILILAVTPASTIDELINQLGDDDFHKRRSAAQQLYDRSPESVPALKEAWNHKDPEIKYSSRHILREIRTVHLRNGVSMPPIWFLPNQERYRDGQDLSLKYYKQVYFQALIHTKNLTSDMNDWEAKSQEKERVRMLTAWLSSWHDPSVKFEYGFSLAEQWATVKYIGDRREQGMSYDDAAKLLDEICENARIMCFRKQGPPSSMIERRVLEEARKIEAWVKNLRFRGEAVGKKLLTEIGILLSRGVRNQSTLGRVSETPTSP